MSAETGQACGAGSTAIRTRLHDISDTDRNPVDQIVFTLDNPVDVDAFASAWQQLYERHEVLGSEPFDTGLPDSRARRASKPGAIDLKLHDWAGLDERVRDARLQELLQAQGKAGFEDGKPLFRIALIHWSEHETRVAWTLRRGLLDWRSVSTLLREVFSNYRYLAGHLADKQPGQDIARVAAYTRRPDNAPVKTDTAFWREFLSGFSTPSSPDLARGARLNGEAAQVAEIRIGAAESNRIRHLATVADVTLNTVAQAAWALLLSHYARTEDVVFGLLRSCRRSDPHGVEDAVGSFLNTIPVRAAVSEECSVLELLAQLHATYRKVREHECSPLAEVEQCAELEAGMRLFETVLEFDSRDPMAVLGELLQAEGPRNFQHYSGSVTGLHLQFHAEEEIILRLKSDSGFIGADAAKQLLVHFSRLLEGMATDPRKRARDIAFLRDIDRAPCRWPETEPSAKSGDVSARPATLHRRFEACAAATPDAIALRCGDRSMRYGELDRAADRLAFRLRERGVRSDSLVGLCVDRSIEQLIGLIGILKAGAGYLPLDPAYPSERLEFMLDDAGVDIVVATQDGRDALGEERFDFIEPVVEEQEIEKPAREVVDTESGQNLAYVIYTSGSTGQPKGVMVTHANVTRLFDTSRDWLQPGPADTWTLFHSFAFDFSVWEIWGALLHGGCLEIIPREIARSPEAFHELLIERGVTVLNQTPSAFRQLMQVDAARGQALPDLRLIVFGGEKLDLGSLSGWVERHGDEAPQLVNMYGITETTVHVTYRRIRREDVNDTGHSMVGWPLRDLYVRLLDGQGRIVPPGVRGEICVGGGGVARGYLNRPQLTSRKFVRDPYAENDDARLYRSGDFARQMPNGELCYLGREDDEVKIRGFRIDLGEIAAAVRSLPGIEAVVVVPRESTGGEKRLFAYYVAAGEPSHSESRLREKLAARLPEHMIPAQFIRLESIPVNANNKVDFRALPDPSEVETGKLDDNEKPATPTEERIARIWQEVLERREIGRSDDFFALGGDSILTLQFVAKARASGMDLAPRDVFNHSVLADLARLARPVSSIAFNEESNVNADGPWALTPIQRWFFDQGFEKPNHWNEGFLFRIPPDTDVDLLERAMLEVVRHHDALHVRFTREDNGPWKSSPVEAEEALEFSRIELDHLDDDERREAMGLITEDIQASLSITSGLLVRAAHFTGGLEDGARLLIVIHQLAVDAASWAIILQDLDAAYRALAAGEAPDLPKRSCSYALWAEQLQHPAATASVASEYAYWERVIAAGKENPLKEATLEPGHEATVATSKVSLEAADTAALLGDIHHAYGTEIHELLVAALARACAAQWPENDCLRIDLKRHGRNDEFGNLDVSRTVGWFTTLHPLALDQSVTQNPARLICDVKTRMRTAPHHGVGWGLLRYVRSSGTMGFGKPALQRAPVLFNYLGHFERVLDNGMFRHVYEPAGTLRGGENHLTHPLTVTAAVHDDRMEFEFRYSRDALPGDLVDSLASQFVRSVQQLVRHCRTRDGIVRTPVDFPLAHLSQEELDDFPVELENAEDILPLSPIQRLYHALFGTDKDVGFDQWVFRLQGRIDEPAFEAAWQELFRRHDALRTIFVDKGLAEPHQVVLRNVDFRLQRTDWRLLNENVQEQRLEEFLAADRRQGFEAHVAPLTRVTLIRAGEDKWILVWSHHQALVDGWSWPIMARELGELHDARLMGRKALLDEPGSYRSYVAWWMDRDRSDYARFWREHLGSGQMVRSLITRSRRKGDGHSGPRKLQRAEIRLPEELSANMAQLARRLRLTPSVVFQAGWALLLSALTRRFDVTMGVAFSGRTAGIPVPEHTVGPFVNDLPVRVRISPTARVDHWLANLRGMQADLNHYQNVSPAEVHEWSETPAGARLFDSLIVFQNYITGEAAHHWGRNINVRDFAAGVRTNYPLTVAVTPGRQYLIEFFHDETVIDSDAVGALANDLETVLGSITRTPDIRIDTIINHITKTHPAESIAASPGRRLADGRWARRAGDIDKAEEVSSAREAAIENGPVEGTLQAEVANVCREVLGIEDFGGEQNFFDVGAQSVSLIEIHERLQTRLQQTFPIVKLFQYPTIASLSHYLEYGESGEPLRDAQKRGMGRRAALQQRRRQSRQPGRFET